MQSYSRFNDTNKGFLNNLNDYYSQLNRLVLTQNLQQFNIVQYIDIVKQIKSQCKDYIAECKKFYLENKNTTDNMKHWFTYNKRKLQELIGSINSYIKRIDSHFELIINRDIYTVNIEDK